MRKVNKDEWVSQFVANWITLSEHPVLALSVLLTLSPSQFGDFCISFCLCFFSQLSLSSERTQCIKSLLSSLTRVKYATSHLQKSAQTHTNTCLVHDKQASNNNAHTSFFFASYGKTTIFLVEATIPLSYCFCVCLFRWYCPIWSSLLTFVVFSFSFFII